MKKITKVLLTIFSILFALLIGAVIFFFISIQPVSKTSNVIRVDIKEGSSSKSIINTLESKGVIKNRTFALLYSKLFKKPNFKAGSFDLDSSWSLDELFEYMSNDSNIIETTVNFTILPGSTVRMIASNLQENTNLNANELIQKWNNKSYISELMLDYPFLTDDIFNENIVMKLEGYFFPDTYNIYKETDIDTVTRTFLNNTLKYFDKYKDKFNSSPYSINELFTLASIVDYEGNTLEDRKNIASVFYNRINIDMPLQSSVTRCYALSIKENRNITDWKECEVALDFDSPYDTYTYYGLPPGPIRCVSETSLVAVLEPNTTNYYYFIGDVCGDGTVYYAETYARHNQLISEVLTKCR